MLNPYNSKGYHYHSTSQGEQSQHPITTNSTNYGLVPLNPDGSITVKLSAAQPLDVNIKNIDTYDELRVDVYSISTSDELDVNLDEVGGGWISNGGPIKVKWNSKNDLGTSNNTKRTYMRKSF